MTSDPGEGFLLLCHEDGRIRAIIHDAIGLDPGIIGHPFAALVHAGGVGKALDFFSAIMRDGAQYAWELSLGRAARTLVFTGARSDGGVVIVGCSSVEGLGRFVDELERLNVPQAGLVKELYCAPRHRLAAPRAVGADEFIRLNNDLANAQRELAKKYADLAKAMEWRKMVLGVAAHDLRNPLSAIGGFAQLLQECIGATLPAMEARMLNQIISSSAYMGRIIDDFLEYSRVETGNFSLERRPVDVGALIADVASSFLPVLTTRGIAITPNVPDGPIVVEADPTRMTQILNNMVGNAIKFAPAGTAVSIGLGRTTDGSGLEIRVSDEGPGVPLKEQDRLFKPFSRTSAQPATDEPGTGLGLAICKSIAEAHGGRIYLDAGAGPGATFVLVLPAQGA